MKTLSILIVFSFLVVQIINCDQIEEDADEFAPIVQLNSGKVRGLLQEVNGRKVHFYEGIPYGNCVLLIFKI